LGVFLQRIRMGASWLPVLLFSVLWGVVGIVLPFVVPRGPHKSVIQVTLMLTAACCWLFWLCCYMSQMNPLIGPSLETKALYAMRVHWDGGE
jgi:V-type H+-transporting ATPase subunit e